MEQLLLRLGAHDAADIAANIETAISAQTAIVNEWCPKEYTAEMKQKVLDMCLYYVNRLNIEAVKSAATIQRIIQTYVNIRNACTTECRADTYMFPVGNNAGSAIAMEQLQSEYQPMVKVIRAVQAALSSK